MNYVKLGQKGIATQMYQTFKLKVRINLTNDEGYDREEGIGFDLVFLESA